MTLKTPVFLAPLAGYTDLPFRRLVRSFGGVGLAFTEMINPTSLLRGQGRKRLCLLATEPEDQPLGWQIYGVDPAQMAEAARRLEGMGAKLIDLNMGCPRQKICRRGAGAALLKTPELALEIVRQVVAAVRIPVSVKIRLGWKEPAGAAELARAMEEAGAAALTIHGRTRAQVFSGAVDLEGIAQVATALRKIPAVANGDVFSVGDAHRMFEQTGCAAIMIGRHALSEPWFLRDVARDLAGQPPLPPPSAGERLDAMRKLFQGHLDLYGDHFGLILFRRWLPRFLKNLRVPREAMVAYLRAATLETWEAEWNRLTAWVAGNDPSGTVEIGLEKNAL